MMWLASAGSHAFATRSRALRSAGAALLFALSCHAFPAAPAALAGEERASLAPEERASLAPEEHASLAPEERASLAPEEHASLAPEERALLAPEERALLAPEERALLEGRADVAIAGLRSTLAAHPGSGMAHLLLCRTYLSEGLSAQAADECQAALNNGLANDSDAQDWTGRAIGREAAHAGIFNGMRLALQVHSAFETAVRLDPNSEPACVDLGEYYTTAPAIVGGGEARALALAHRIEAPLPAVAHRIRAMAAENAKDFATAEREFQAEATAGHSPGALVDLAAFYGRRHEDAKAAEAARETIALDRRLDATVIEAAGVLRGANQLQLAEQAMQSYLERGDKSDTAPAFRVYTMLGSLQARSGDRSAARADYEQALSLASQYAPAQKGLGAL